MVLTYTDEDGKTRCEYEFESSKRGNFCAADDKYCPHYNPNREREKPYFGMEMRGVPIPHIMKGCDLFLQRQKELYQKTKQKPQNVSPK